MHQDTIHLRLRGAYSGKLRQVFPDASKGFSVSHTDRPDGQRTEFTYKYISDTEKYPFDKVLEKAGIPHKLIPRRTPWHNGKVERSHRNDQRYFYDWEKFSDVKELNRKLAAHLDWINRKPMRTLGGKSPVELLREKLAAAC